MGFENLTRPPLSREEKQRLIPPADILVDDSEAYFDRANGELRRLENGFTIIGLPKGRFDSLDSLVTVSFPNFPCLEPIGKIGQSHVMEHLLGSSTDQRAGQLLIDQNANVSGDTVRYEADGHAIPAVQEFGLFPFIPHIADMLADPLLGLAEPQAIFDGQKERVLTEINRNMHDSTRRMRHALNSYLYSEENPNAHIQKMMGISTDVASLQLEDIRTYAQQVLVPTHAIIEVLSEGSPEVNAQLVDRLAGAFTEFPRVGHENADLPSELIDSFNTGFHEGAEFSLDIGIPDNQVTITHIWQVDTGRYTVENYALIDYLTLAQQATRKTNEMKGWGYVAKTHNPKIGEKLLVCVEVVISTDKNDGRGRRDPFQIAKQLGEDIQNHVLPIDDEAIALLCSQQKKILPTVPVYASARMFSASAGIAEFDRAIDSEKLTKIHSQVEPSHLANLRDQLLQTAPAVAIIGDLR